MVANKKNRAYRAFSLAEVLVSMGIFSVLLLITTTTLTQMVRIKKTAEYRAEVTDNLQTTLETMKRYLLEANAAEVNCSSVSSPNVCDLCTLGIAGSERCQNLGGTLRFVYSPDGSAMLMYHGADEEAVPLTSVNVEVRDVIFNQVGEYVFVLLKGGDTEGKTIPEGQEIVMQSSVVLRSDE